MTTNEQMWTQVDEDDRAIYFECDSEDKEDPDVLFDLWVPKTLIKQIKQDALKAEIAKLTVLITALGEDSDDGRVLKTYRDQVLAEEVKHDN